MEALPNSRKLNGISLVEYLQQDGTGKITSIFAWNLLKRSARCLLDKDKKYNSIVKTPKRNSQYNNNTKRHPVSKVFLDNFKLNKSIDT
jgi:hypothetical protein